MPKRKPTRKTSQKIPEMLKTPSHQWRLCPTGYHFRRGGPVSTYTKKDGTLVHSHFRSESCVANLTGKDQLYAEEISEIALKNFSKLDTLGSPLGFGELGNKYDNLIQGWTQYWNEVLMPSESLDPKLVKALIASESGFDFLADNKRKGPRQARGLMQVTNESVRYLSDDYKELDDHYLNLTSDDMIDPNLSICAGVRWLFRKKQLTEHKLKRKATWVETVEDFKSAKKNIGVMEGFNSYYYRLLKGLK